MESNSTERDYDVIPQKDPDQVEMGELLPEGEGQSAQYRDQQTALALAGPGQVSAPKLSLTQVMEYAKIFISSGLFKDIKSIYQAMVKIQAGNELGFPPFASMNMLDIIEGKIEVKPVGMRALIRRDGKYDYVIEELTNDRAVVTFYRIDYRGRKELLGTSVFTQDDAKRAELAGKGTWKKYPRNMLVNRATSNGVRWYCPDIAATVMYATGELTGEDAGIEDAEGTLVMPDREQKGEIEALYDEVAMFMSAEQKVQYEQMYWDEEVTDEDMIIFLNTFK